MLSPPEYQRLLVRLKAAAQQGWIDGERAMMEVLTAIKRSGADLIITYFAEQLARWL